MDVLPDVRTGVRPHSIHPLKRSATKLGGWTHIACSATSGHASGLCLAHPYFCPDWMRPEASVRAIFVRMRIRPPHQLSGVLCFLPCEYTFAELNFTRRTLSALEPRKEDCWV